MYETMSPKARPHGCSPGLSEFADREQDVRAFIAARVWASAEGPRVLLDRAVVYMLEAEILLPAGITKLTRLVSKLRRAEHSRLYGLLAERTPMLFRQCGNVR
jgi:hypothetical protein